MSFAVEGAAGEDLEFEAIVGGHAASIEGVFDRLFAEEDLVNALFAGDAFGVVAVVVERLFELGDLGDFGNTEAEVVVLAVHEFGVEAADLLEDAGVHQAEVENDEFGKEPIVVIINLAMLAVGLHGTVFTNDDVVGVDHADVGMIFEIVDGFG